MCPNRFAPLEGLLSVYITTKDSTAAYDVARTIVNKREKVHSEATEEIKRMAQEYLDKQYQSDKKCDNNTFTVPL